MLRDDDGTVVISSVMAFGDTLHTFVERTNYNGAFLPGYAPIEEDDLMNSVFESIEYEFIDHIVANMPENEMQPTVEWYINMLDFHRYAMFDDKIIHTEYSALRSTVVSDWDETIKIPVNEPENKVRRS